MWYKAPGETLDEVVARLCQEDLRGASGRRPAPRRSAGRVLEKLEEAGAQVAYLPVYRMTSNDGQAAADLIATVIGYGAQAVSFTAAPQVEVLAAQPRHWPDSSTAGRLQQREGGSGVHRPVCAEGARAAGIERPLVPEHPRLGSLTKALAGTWASTTPRLTVCPGEDRSGEVQVRR